jgi:hypothetical protein
MIRQDSVPRMCSRADSVQASATENTRPLRRSHSASVGPAWRRAPAPDRPRGLGGEQRAGVVVALGLLARDQVSAPIGELGEVLAQVDRDLIGATAGAELGGEEGRELLARGLVDVAHERPGVLSRPLLQVFVVGLPGVGLDARGR